MYEVYPEDHPDAGRRRFKRCGLSLPKGMAKTECAAWIAAVELHPEGPVRTVGWREGLPIGGPVQDPYIPMVAFTEEQSDELAYGALRAILMESTVSNDFDIGLERVMRIHGDGKAVSLSGSPSARDGARTTFQLFDEPLALDTSIPTPSGWRTMEDLRPGDMVYGRNGRACNVVGVGPVHHGRPCYRVTFEGGDSIVTDENHRWRAIDWRNRPAGEQVVTTKEMCDGGVDTGYGKRWRLPRNSGFEGVTQNLPLHPYLLGLWLGDGDSRNATISSGCEDYEETRRRIEGLGYTTSECAVKGGRAPLMYVSSPEASVQSLLKRNDLMGNKHIPALYAFSHRDQRIALLQGLMDSDGHVTDAGNCTFVQGKREMAEQVQSLVRSLGIPASLVISSDDRSRTGVMCKVHFTPDFCAFKLRRKADRCQGEAVHRWPTIVNIEPCESVPVRCIAVDSPDHLFLAGRGLRLTHNTHHLKSDKLRRAHGTMMANIPKRRLADAWSLETTTAFEPGENSIAERTMEFARAIDEGRSKDAQLFFFHRQADENLLRNEEGEIDLADESKVAEAIAQASGPHGGFRDIPAILGLARDPTTDAAFFTRVWCNVPIQASTKAFDLVAFRALQKEGEAREGARITVGFDGAQTRDATGIVCTDIATGYQWVEGCWECPFGKEGTWRVPAHEVDECLEEIFRKYDVWRAYLDPPYWQSWVSTWQGKFGDDRIIEWWTNRRRQMAFALERYSTAIDEKLVSHRGDEELLRHVGNAYRLDMPHRDEDNNPLWLIRKERPDSPYKIDLAMAAVLSWEARCDAVALGIGDNPVFPVELEAILE